MKRAGDQGFPAVHSGPQSGATGEPETYVVVASGSQEVRTRWMDIVRRSGGQAIEACNAPELSILCRTLAVALVVSELGLPGTDAIAMAESVGCDRAIPFVVVSEQFEQLTIVRAGTARRSWPA